MIRYLSIPIGIFALQACSGLGYQGGAIPTTFTGITTAQAVSPQTIQLSWDAYPGAYKYNVYTPNVNDPIYTPGFNSILFKPVPSDPNVTYQYSVTAIDPSTGKEQGVRSSYTPVSLLPHFNFQTSGSITPTSKTAVRVSWASQPTVNYMVFLTERLPTGSVNYNSFVASSFTGATNSAVISGLSEGHEYCAVVVAAYSDQTNDAPNGTLFTGEVGATLSGSTYMVGASGTFGDSVIAQTQKCVRTQSDFNITSLKVYTQKASLSSQPIFYVSVPGDTTEDTNGTVSTSIYQVNSTTGLSTVIGSRTGTGKITAQSAIPSGRYQFFAVVSDLATPAQAVAEINVGPTGATPTSPSNRPWVYVRSFNATESPTASTGYYPEKQQDGFGSQLEGSAVAIGDFNCDGKKDIAIGVPTASTMAADNRPAKSGKVVIYYDVTNLNPATATRTQVITFDFTGYGGDAARDLQLGTSLYAGNFNGDTQATNQYGGSGLSKIFQCDDLAIGSGYGPMFVVYGKRDVVSGGGDGGLNYVNPTGYSLNPSSTCQPASNICQVGAYTQATAYSSALGTKMTAGDYNGDGFLDLAVTSSSGNTPHGVWVFRGSEYGLIAPTAYTGGVDTVATTPGTYLSFPYLPASPAAFAPSPTPYAGWGLAGSGFGSSISTLHNAYYDTDSTKTKGTKRIRDVLLIGNPMSFTTTGSNQVHACIPKSNYTASSWGTIGSTVDVNTSLYWDCSGIIVPPVDPATSVQARGFGTAMVDLVNPLRYQPNQFGGLGLGDVSGCPEGFGNCSTTSTNLGYPGGVAVSAISGSVPDVATGSVYVYYGVNNPVAYTLGTCANDRDCLGIYRNYYLAGMLAGTSTIAGYHAKSTGIDTTSPAVVSTGSACFVGGNASASPPTSFEYCNVQKIQHPTTSAGSFGFILGAVPGNVTPGGVGNSQSKDTVLAVAAPYRDYTLSNGSTYSNVGSVQLYLQNSQFETSPILVRSSSNSGTPCDNTGVCRFADGFSNTLTTSLDYDGTIANNVNFGLGGVVGGPLMPGDSLYNPNSDIVIGAPGHVAHPAVTSGTVPSVIDNGAAIAFFSHGGTYRNYEVASPDTNTAVSPWHIMDNSFSQESDMKFHEAISIGDINQDGIGDVAVRINQGSRNFIRIYNGSPTKVGFDTTAGDFTTFQVQGDSTAGIRFVPMGNIANTSLPAYLVTGANASYILFDGIGGLVGGFPTAFGTGGVPRKLYRPVSQIYDSVFTSTNSSGYAYFNFGDAQYYNSEVSGNLDSTLRSYANFVHGDFNGDGFEDVAIGFNTSGTIADMTQSLGCTGTQGATSNNYCGNTGVGRVMIFYGGADNGFQVQPDTNGGYPMNNAYFTDYSADATTEPNESGHSFWGPPCAPDGTGCKIQMIHEGTSVTNTTKFGQTLAAVPAGFCTNSSGTQYPVKSLVVSGLKGGAPYLYTYRPKCLDSAFSTNFSGLVSYSEDSSLPATLTLPVTASSSFAQTMISVKDLMGTAPTNTALLSHLVVTDQASAQVVVYPVHTIDSNKASFEVPATNAIGSTGFAAPSFTADGGRFIDYSASAMLSGTNGTNVGFGNGLASIGDVNGDGYRDIGIGITSLNRKDTASQVLNQGTVLVLFGGPSGLQSHTSTTYTTELEPSRTATCYISPSGASAVSTCNPNLLYVPEPTNSLRNGAYERSFLSQYSYVATSTTANEALGTFLFGVPGRDSLDTLPSQRILQGGAFYVLP